MFCRGGDYVNFPFSCENYSYLHVKCVYINLKDNLGSFFIFVVYSYETVDSRFFRNIMRFKCKISVHNIQRQSVLFLIVLDFDENFL